MADPLVVLLHSPKFVPPDVLAHLGSLVPSGFRWEPLEQGAPADARRAAFARADYVFAYPGDPRPDELAVAKRLKLFQLLSAGYDWLDLDAFRRAGVRVATNEGANAVSTAEHTLLLILALLKLLPAHHAATASGKWLGMEHTMQLRELRGRTVGLVGFGRIAQQVAKRLRAFDAVVRYTKPTRAPAEEERAVEAEYRSFEALLEESDVLSLHAPLTPATRGMIDARALARMPRGSRLVNTARGALVDEAALAAALAAGHLAGAALDAFAHEPLEPSSPLLGLHNVVLTPHVAGVTRDTWSERLRIAWGNVARVAAGEEPISRIA
jgi:D-3-phosphoglycerate dehydrogenase